MQRFELIDYLKGYSIFTIMLFHYVAFLQVPAPFDQLIFFGGTGVHLFVLLSGFGLYYSYLRKPIAYPAFLKKRFLKIYVPYILIIILSALLSLGLPIYDNSLYAFGGHVFLYKMFDEQIMGSYGYPLWFISMIIQFYVCFYILVWLKHKMSNTWFLGFGVLLSIGWALTVFLLHKENLRIWNSFFLQYLWEFALGMFLADRVFSGKSIPGTSSAPWRLLVLALINCALYAAIALGAGSVGKLFNDFFALTGYSLLAIFIYLLRIKPVNQFFVYIGSISLSVYLLHILVLLILSSLFAHQATWLPVLISMAIIIPLSALYQRGIRYFFKVVKL